MRKPLTCSVLDNREGALPLLAAFRGSVQIGQAISKELHKRGHQAVLANIGDDPCLARLIETDAPVAEFLPLLANYFKNVAKVTFLDPDKPGQPGVARFMDLNGRTWDEAMPFLLSSSYPRGSR